MRPSPGADFALLFKYKITAAIWLTNKMATKTKAIVFLKPTSSVLLAANIKKYVFPFKSKS
jgi:hypothetical protein